MMIKGLTLQQLQVLTTLVNEPFESTVRRRENAGKPAFSLFPMMPLNYSKIEIIT